jgi:hypothetical protein
MKQRAAVVFYPFRALQKIRTKLTNPTGYFCQKLHAPGVVLSSEFGQKSWARVRHEDHRANAMKELGARNAAGLT